MAKNRHIFHWDLELYLDEAISKRPLLPNLCACPVAPEDGTGVRLKF